MPIRLRKMLWRWKNDINSFYMFQYQVKPEISLEGSFEFLSWIFILNCHFKF